jgi:hypothetical protein
MMESIGNGMRRIGIWDGPRLTAKQKARLRAWLLAQPEFAALAKGAKK